MLLNYPSSQTEMIRWLTTLITHSYLIFNAKKSKKRKEKKREKKSTFSYVTLDKRLLCYFSTSSIFGLFQLLWEYFLPKVKVHIGASVYDAGVTRDFIKYGWTFNWIHYSE